MKKSWLVLGSLIAVLAVLIGFLCTWYGVLPYPSQIKTVEERGQFGDSFGFLSALASSLGFIGLLFTLALQQRQISEQAKEIKRQDVKDREERQREELDRFEELLFKLLEFYLESVDAILLVRQGREYKGRDALSICIKNMERELKRRNLHYLPEANLNQTKSATENKLNVELLDYVALETCRVIQYTLPYQRRVIASLRALLHHLESRCPQHADVDIYRSVVSAQLTHLELQYFFAIALIYKNEAELRNLFEASKVFVRDSPPYVYKLHQFLYARFWGKVVGDASLARTLVFSSKQGAQIRALAKQKPLADLIRRYRISDPVRPETMGQEEAW